MTGITPILTVIRIRLDTFYLRIFYFETLNVNLTFSVCRKG